VFLLLLLFLLLFLFLLAILLVLAIVLVLVLSRAATVLVIESTAGSERGAADSDGDEIRWGRRVERVDADIDCDYEHRYAEHDCVRRSIDAGSLAFGLSASRFAGFRKQWELNDRRMAAQAFVCPAFVCPFWR